MPIFFRSSSPRKGFTLIEVLISVAIIAALGALTIPNFIRFNEEQILKNETLSLLQGLRQMQANAQSRVKCQNTFAINWQLILSNNGYQYQSTCDGSPPTLESPRPKASFPANISLNSVKCNTDFVSTRPVIISFSKTATTSADCPNGKIIIELIDTKLPTGSNISTITVDKGGSIYASNI